MKKRRLPNEQTFSEQARERITKSLAASIIGSVQADKQIMLSGRGPMAHNLYFTQQDEHENEFEITMGPDRIRMD